MTNSIALLMLVLIAFLTQTISAAGIAINPSGMSLAQVTSEVAVRPAMTAPVFNMLAQNDPVVHGEAKKMEGEQQVLCATIPI